MGMLYISNTLFTMHEHDTKIEATKPTIEESLAYLELSNPLYIWH